MEGTEMTVAKIVRVTGVLGIIFGLVGIFGSLVEVINNGRIEYIVLAITNIGFICISWMSIQSVSDLK